MDKLLIGPDMLAEMEQEILVIKKNLKEARNRHKCYANQNRLFKEFQVEEYMYLHINSNKRSLRIGSCANLAPWFCGPFKIFERIGLVAYQLPLPLIVKVNDVFHVPYIKKYVKCVDHVIDWSVLQVDPDGEF